MLCPPGVRTKKSGTKNLNPRKQDVETKRLRHLAARPHARSNLQQSPQKVCLPSRNKVILLPVTTPPPARPLWVGGPESIPSSPVSPGWPLVLTPFPRTGSAWSGRLAHGVVCVHWLVKKNKHRSKLRPFLSSRAPPPAREMQTAGGRGRPELGPAPASELRVGGLGRVT